ncbi:MAG: adenosylcobalamin-dependent ribonucleoside-diphosphate reductase [Pseudomonadales bacterium]
MWESRYRYCPSGGNADTDPSATFERVAHAAASVEPHDRTRWQQHFQELFDGLAFVPGGRILAGAGTKRRVTLCNCFVMGALRDDLAAIFDGLKEGALTMQQGGGIGYDFSPLRPRGARAEQTANIASGPVSFMRVWDAMCDTMVSTSYRRGAMMATLRCDHPDILRFVRAKRDRRSLTHFNCSVLVSDALMAAVAEDAPWPLRFDGQVHETVSARGLWDEIVRQAYEASEPGVLFVDQINRSNNLWYCETLSATNPCGEVPLPPYGACNLGSFNLTAFVRAPFSAAARFDHTALAAQVPVAVRLLDNVIDLSRFPLGEQRAEAHASRRVGLGFMGLGSALAMLGLHYDSEAARAAAAAIMTTLRDAAYAASCALAGERGVFPRFRRDEYLRGSFVERLPAPLQTDIGRLGLRNSHLTAIAPTGTISLLADNVSSGIEPIFETRYQRRIRRADETLLVLDVEDRAHRLWRAGAPPDATTPEAFVAARDLSPEAHLNMQAAVQPLVDQAISKTINVPEGIAFDAFRDIYRKAFELEVKGVTTFRPRPDRPGVIT